jgi:hypothetical protein
MSVQSESARGPRPAPVSPEVETQPTDDRPRRRSRRSVSALPQRSGPNGSEPKPVDREEPGRPNHRIIEATGDIFYLTSEGMESHLQIKGTDTLFVLAETQIAIANIVEAGGTARVKGVPNNGANGKTAESNLPYYVDEQGVKRCNRLTVDGERCGQPVSQRDGQYGPFWSCKNYKNHAPNKGGRNKG